MRISKTLIAALLASVMGFCAAFVESAKADCIGSDGKSECSARKGISSKEYGIPNKSYRWFSGR